MPESVRQPVEVAAPDPASVPRSIPEAYQAAMALSDGSRNDMVDMSGLKRAISTRGVVASLYAKMNGHEDAPWREPGRSR